MQYDDGRGLPTDFPSEPGFHFYFAHWGLPCLALLLFLAVAIAAMVMTYRIGYGSVGQKKAVSDRIDLIRNALREKDKDGNPRFTPDQIEGRAGEAIALIESDNGFGRTLNLAMEINTARDGLVKALTGMKEEDAAPSGLPVQSVASGATVINIAVNQNTVNTSDPAVIMPGPYANVASTPVPIAEPKPEMVPVPEPERQQSIWRALQALMFFWKNPSAKAAFENAQQQLLFARPFTPPPPRDEAVKAPRMVQ